MSNKVYEVVASTLIAMVEQGTVPWRMPWSQCPATNLVSNKPYRGANRLILQFQSMAKGYSSSYWMSFKQASERGGTVKKGEHGTPIVFWSFPDPDKKLPDGKKDDRVYVRYYNVFNLDQTEGVQVPANRISASNTPVVFEDSKCNAVFDSYISREQIAYHEGGEHAFYSPSKDAIHVPYKHKFVSFDEFHSCRFHEMVHSTGKETRCNRKLGTSFGSHEYSEEELVAEFGASFLCSMTGITRQQVVENSAAYLGNWARIFRNDPKVLIMSAQRAQRAVDFILGVQNAEESLTEQLTTA